MNKIILIGNLTRDPEVTVTTNGVKVGKISIAVNRSYTNDNGEKEADFITIVAWRNLAENAEKYLNKGNKIAVVGNLQTRQYDAPDGTKRYATEVVANEIEYLITDRNNANNATNNSLIDKKPIDDEGLPF